MKTQRNALSRRVAAGIGALALGLMGALGGGMAANAALTEGPNIDQNSGSIIVHKFEEPDTPTGLPNDGTVVNTTALTPLDGVTFTAERIKSIDLMTYEGWDTADGLTATTVIADPTTYPLDTAVARVTGETPEPAGTATFANLPVGLYLVTETHVGDNPIAVKAEPFLVSVPLPMGDNMWLYDVHVYPKNAVTTTEKTVDDSGAYGLGDVVEWTITAEVPNLAADDHFTRFIITDTLDARLGFSAATVSLTDADADPVALDAGDYDLVTPPVGSSGLVSVTFTPAGLVKLEGAQGSAVTIELDTTVLSIGDGTIENEATVVINEFEGDVDAVTNWGALEINKIAMDGDEKVYLAGAEFQLFTSESDALLLTKPVSVNGQTTFTSDADGEILIEGLKAGDYWLVETKAPAGYTGHDGAIRVTVVTGSIEDAVLHEVLNAQRPSVDLPLTGANGVLLLTLGGAGLLSLAGGTALVNQRRKSARE